jgi:chaperone modulatory protein CbpM
MRKPTCHRLASTALIRARRLVNIERTFDANAEVSALVVDLLEEVSSLRNQLEAAKQRPS